MSEQDGPVEGMESAYLAAGGVAEFRALIQDAKVFLPASERANFNSLVADPDPDLQREGVRMLRKLQQEHKTSPRPESLDPQKSVEAYRLLQRRAAGGDEQAWSEYIKIDPNQIPV